MGEKSLTITGMYHVKLLASKTRVTPMKVLTIPRLEMMSGRILAKLMVRIKTAIETKVEITEIHYWLDNKTAFCWINNRDKWKQFVPHRVNDLGSTGVLSSRLKRNELWLMGSRWLSGPENK